MSRIAGGIAKITVAMSAVGTPMPNSSTTGTRYENAGIVCIASSTGRITRSTEGRLPAQIPTGMPISSAMMTANRISARVSMLGTHSPSTPMNSEAARRQHRETPAGH